MKRMVKVRVNFGGRVLKHAFIGVFFAVMNEMSYKILQKPKNSDEDLSLMNFKQSDQELLQLNEVFYKKEEIFKKIENNFHLTPDSRSSEFTKNFMYGSLIVFLGVEGTKYLRTLPHIKNASSLNQILLGIPLAIVPYYAFCCFYDRKPMNEFWKKLKEDFVPLGVTKFCFDLTQAGYAERIKNIVMKNGKSFERRMKRATWMLIIFNSVWIFLLTSFYHERVKVFSNDEQMNGKEVSREK